MRSKAFYLSLGLWMSIGCASGTGPVPEEKQIVEPVQEVSAVEVKPVVASTKPEVSLADSVPMMSLRISSPERIFNREGLFSAFGIASMAARVFVSALALPLVGVLDLNYDVVVHVYRGTGNVPEFFAVLRPVADPVRVQTLHNMLKQSGFPNYCEHEGFVIVSDEAAKLAQDKKLLNALVQNNTPWSIGKSTEDRCRLQLDCSDFTALSKWVEQLYAITVTPPTSLVVASTAPKTPENTEKTKPEVQKDDSAGTEPSKAPVAQDVTQQAKTIPEESIWKNWSQKEYQELVLSALKEFRRLEFVLDFAPTEVVGKLNIETNEPWWKMPKQLAIPPFVILPEGSKQSSTSASRNSREFLSACLHRVADHLLMPILTKPDFMKVPVAQQKPASEALKQKMTAVIELLMSKLSDSCAGATGVLKDGSIAAASCYHFPGVKTLEELLSLNTSALTFICPRWTQESLKRWALVPYLRSEGNYNEVPLYGVGTEMIIEVVSALSKGETPPNVTPKNDALCHLAYVNEELIVANTLDLLKQQIDARKKKSGATSSFFEKDELCKIDSDALPLMNFALSSLGLNDYRDPTVTSAPWKASTKIHDREINWEWHVSYALIAWLYHLILWAVEQEDATTRWPTGAKIPVTQSPSKQNFVQTVVPVNVAQRQILIPVKSTTEYRVASEQRA